MDSSTGNLLRGAPLTGRPCPVDQHALEYLKLYAGAIRYCINAHHVPDHARADVHQDVSVRVIRRFRKFGPVTGASSSWIYRVTRCACISYWRDHRKGSEPSDKLDLVAADTTPADEWLDRQDAHQRLHLAVATLPPMSKEIMRRVLLGQSLVEIAHALEIEHGTAKVAAHRARLLLRKRLIR